MPKDIRVHTGGVVLVPGQYRPSGGRTEYTFSEGIRVPPNNQGVRQSFSLVDETKHKR